MKRLPFVLLLFALCLLPAAPAASAAGPATAAVAIRPELELLAGVLSHTDWPRQVGLEGKGNDYYEALKTYLAPYKEHEAVALYKEMMEGGFAYDAPPTFVLHLGPLPNLEQLYPYSPELVQRAGGQERLERFRLALKDLAAQSRFTDFVAQWQPRYDQWIQAVGPFDAAKVINWHETFFREPGKRQFHMILAPAFYPQGGYGPTVVRPDGQRLVYYIVRSDQKGSGAPTFPSGRDLESLGLHEWGHSYVNPANERSPEKIARLQPHHQAVYGQMKAQAYGSVTPFVNEQVLRAVTTLATEDLAGPDAARKALAREERRGFYLTAMAVEALREYRANPDRYPTFADFAPVLLDRMAAEPPIPPARFPWLAVSASLAVATVLGTAAWRRYRFSHRPKAS